MGCIPLGTSTVLGLQIRYLETNGIFNIYVIVHQDSVTKTRSFLLQHYEADERSNIYLVVVKEEETESTNALKMMCELQATQDQMVNLPEYEQELYRKKGSKH